MGAYALWGMNIDGSKRKLYEFKTAQGMIARPKLTSLLPDDPKNVMVKINERRGLWMTITNLTYLQVEEKVASGPDISKEEWLAQVVEKADGFHLQLFQM